MGRGGDRGGDGADESLPFETEAVGAQAAALEPPSGTRIHRYIVVEKVGHGGTSVVFKAYDPELNRRVAIKLLRPQSTEVGGTSQARTRLVREAQALAQLSHPNVIAVYDVGTWEGHVFLAMEFVEGQSLRKWLQERRRTTGQILEMFIAAGRGLAATHAVGLIHRDFKPDNVMVGDDGRVRVVDFGLARAHEADEAASQADQAVADAARASSEPADPALPPSQTNEALLARALTKMGAIVGTPAFMSPEQFRALELDARTDQFSFCASLYWALYRKLPFAGWNTANL